MEPHYRPFDDVPNEIIITIFRCVIAEFNHPLGKGTVSPLAHLILVCKRWKDVAIGDTSLWTFLYFTPHNRNSAEEHNNMGATVREYLRRSGNRSVDLHLQTVEDGISMETVFGWLEDYLPKIRHITFMARHFQDQNSVLQVFTRMMNLRSLWIADLGNVPWTAFRFLTVAEFAIKEEEIWRPEQLAGLIYALVVWPQLESLDITFEKDSDPTDTIVSYFLWHLDESLPSPFLPILKKLVLKGINSRIAGVFLTYLIAPALEDLELVGTGETKGTVDCHFTNIQKLTIAGWTDCDYLLSCIALCSPGIQELDVRGHWGNLRAYDIPINLPTLCIIRLNTPSLPFARHVIGEKRDIEVVLEVPEPRVHNTAADQHKWAEYWLEDNVNFRVEVK